MSEEQRRAGLLLRTAARAVDLILIAAVAEMIPKAGYYAGLAYLLLADGLFDGRSVGKKLIRIKVVSSSGGPCTFRDSIIRNGTLAVGYVLALLPWIGRLTLPAVMAVELIFLVGSREGRRIGDELAGTTVLEDRPV